jgi:uncharacterized protein (DUF362 family)
VIIPPTPTLHISTATPKPAPIRLPQSVVGVVQSAKAKATDIQYADIQAMVQQAVDLAGGMQTVVKDGQTVVIKPNLMGKTYTASGQEVAREVSGLATDWRVTKAAVELVRRHNPSGKVYVMDGSSLLTTAENMQYLNYTPEHIPGVDAFIPIETDSGKWKEETSPGLVKMSVPDGLLWKEYYLNKKYKEADVVISMPVLKNHSYAAVTGAIKNVAMGSSPANIYGKSATDINRFNSIPHDMQLHRWIHDYYRCRPVQFAIMDGLQGLQNGPMCFKSECDINKDQMNMRLIVAGRDALAVDTIAALLMGWDPESIEYLRLLNASSTGNLDTAAITVAGQPVSAVRKDFAGDPPLLGGQTVGDKTPPELTIEKADISSGELKLQLGAQDKTHKVEVYVDDHMIGAPVAENFAQVKLDASGVAQGAHTVKVRAYDRFLNQAEQVTEITF